MGPGPGRWHRMTAGPPPARAPGGRALRAALRQSMTGVSDGGPAAAPGRLASHCRAGNLPGRGVTVAHWHCEWPRRLAVRRRGPGCQWAPGPGFGSPGWHGAAGRRNEVPKPRCAKMACETFLQRPSPCKSSIWNPVPWYIPVYTGIYRYILCYGISRYMKQVKSIYQYVPVYTFLRIFQKVYTGTY